MADQDQAASPHDEQAERPYHSKRPHKKSRKGCTKCKARKVKCDEARPTCRSCRMRKVECVYASSTPSQPGAEAETDPQAARASPTATSPASSSASSALVPVPGRGQSPPSQTSPLIITEPLYRPTSSVDEVDMKLLWFYSTYSYLSFTVHGDNRRSVQDVMKSTVVRYAFETPFLMHSLFALAGMQMQTLDPTFDPARTASYRARAFEGYRMAVQEAKPETYPALMANSLFLTALSSQSFREPGCGDLYIIDWMVVWRGIGLIFDLLTMPRLFESGLDALFRRPSIDLDKSALAIPNHLLFMFSSIPLDDADYPEVADYYSTLKYLGSLYLTLRQEGFSPAMKLRIITWFTFIPYRFVDLCRSRRPRALVILSHYAVFLKVTQHVWWLAGVGHRSICDLCNHLESDWYHLLGAPLMAIHADDRLELARILLDDPSWTSPSTESGDSAQTGIGLSAMDQTWVDQDGKENPVPNYHRIGYR